jgi:hypothetical protein
MPGGLPNDTDLSKVDLVNTILFIELYYLSVFLFALWQLDLFASFIKKKSRETHFADI